MKQLLAFCVIGLQLPVLELLGLVPLLFLRIWKLSVKKVKLICHPSDPTSWWASWILLWCLCPVSGIHLLTQSSKAHRMGCEGVAARLVLIAFSSPFKEQRHSIIGVKDFLSSLFEYRVCMQLWNTGEFTLWIRTIPESSRIFVRFFGNPLHNRAVFCNDFVCYHGFYWNAKLPSLILVSGKFQLSPTSEVFRGKQQFATSIVIDVWCYTCAFVPVNVEQSKQLSEMDSVLSFRE